MSDPEQKVERARREAHRLSCVCLRNDPTVPICSGSSHAAIDALVLVARQAERVEALEDVRDAFARVPVQFARIIEMLDAARKAAKEGA